MPKARFDGGPVQPDFMEGNQPIAEGLGLDEFQGAFQPKTFIRDCRQDPDLALYPYKTNACLDFTGRGLKSLVCDLLSDVN